MCPKVLNAYNASIILKCLHTPIMLKIMMAYIYLYSVSQGHLIISLIVVTVHVIKGRQ